MRCAVLFLLCASSLALAQHERADVARQHSQVPATPLSINGGLFHRQPKLRSLVKGWSLTGSRPRAYELRCDGVFTDCAVPILRTRSFTDEPFGMGSLTHSESAEPWRGRRVELKAELRTGDTDGWAGLWMRVDGKDARVLAFDNMQDRPLRGTTGFEWYSVVLDVPADAERVSFGVLLHGPGAVFVRELVFGEVDAKVPVTDLVGPLRSKDAG